MIRFTFHMLHCSASPTRVALIYTHENVKIYFMIQTNVPKAESAVSDVVRREYKA